MMEESVVEDSTMEEISAGNNNGKTKFPPSLKKSPFFSNLRSQLNDQLKSLDNRLECQLSLTAELQDFFRKKSDIELEFSKMMEKMFKQLSANHQHSNQQIFKSNNAVRKESLTSTLLLQQQTQSASPLISSSGGSLSNPAGQQLLNTVMLQLMNETRKEAKERSVLGEICTLISTRIAFVQEDLQRVFKQCREVCSEGQSELLKVLHELHTSTKSYQSYRLEWKTAETKQKIVESQKAKLEVQLGKPKLEKSKKFKVVEKEAQKRLRKSNDSRFKYLKAKNEYLLCLDAANAAVHKYFVEDLSDLIDCMDLGYYESITNALRLYMSSEEVKKDSIRHNIETLQKLAASLDSRVDKQKFLEANNTHFVLPKKFVPISFQQEEEDQEDTLLKAEDVQINNSRLETESFMREELEQRMYQLDRRLATLRMESNELWKTLETAEHGLLNLIAQSDNSVKVKDWFVGHSHKDIHHIDLKARADRIDTDLFHINKYRDYMLVTNRISRLQSKYDHIREVLGVVESVGPTSRASPCGRPVAVSESSSQVIRRKRIGGQNLTKNNGGIKLFGGSIEEYLEFNKNYDIPVVLKSAIRVINLFGLHHQGIFRVSGSQVEINNFRDSFERGEDPLAEMNDASDINSVASLLKLYLRELREPLFPIVFFDIFMELAQLDNATAFTSRMRDLVTKSLTRPVFVVLRYLFHFLNHLSEYSDENMMDGYNLAICFGPTLVPVPEDKDQVQYQNLVNELIKNVIVNAHEIFLNDGSNEVYEKYAFSPQQHNNKEENIPEIALIAQEEEKIEDNDDVFESACSFPMFPSDFLVDGMEALAQYDFKARSPRELSFKKGQTLLLLSQVSCDWWKGRLKANETLVGLIPDKYILIKIRDEDIPTSFKESPKFSQRCKKRSVSSAETKSHHQAEILHHRSLSLSERASPSHAAEPATAEPVAEPAAEPATATAEPVGEPIAAAQEPPPDPSPSRSPLPARDPRICHEMTPDLVMDLPLADNSSGDESSGGPSSSESLMTGAEVFAKQNQCTLKKSLKPHPQVVKVKPQVMAKPKLPFIQQKVLVSRKPGEDEHHPKDEDEQEEHKKKEP